MYQKLFREIALWSGLMVLAGASAGSVAFIAATEALGQTRPAVLHLRTDVGVCGALHTCSFDSWCNPGERITGGGFRFTDSSDWGIAPPQWLGSFPVFSADPNYPVWGWSAKFYNNAHSGNVSIEVIAACLYERPE